jgi:regulator of protease activity HflC (stomatin/prohibitin superfamily)
MRSVLGAFSYDQVIANRNALNEKLNDVIGNSIVTWGVSCTRFEVQTFKPANREVERQLELQLEAERNRRKQLLDTQAQVNVAEGHKQRVILESEGLLEAKSNEADAHYKTVFREAEARKQQGLMEASALASQVEEIARSLAKNADVVEPSDRKNALSALIELRRLQQLKAIAESKSNSTYFFGDKAALGQDSYSIDYAEQVKGGLHSRDGKATGGRETAGAAMSTV